MRTASHFHRPRCAEAAGKSGAESLFENSRTECARPRAQQCTDFERVENNYDGRISRVAAPGDGRTPGSPVLAQTARPAEGTFNLQLSTLHRTHALTLLEMMVSMTLLAVIMIGLLAMFSHTQKALHIAATQTDVFENARGAMQLVSRDLSEMTAFGVTNIVHTRFVRFNSPIDPLVLANGSNQPILLNEGFWLTQVNDQWQGIGYYVSDDPLRGNSGVGTLYRFSGQTRRQGAEFLLTEFETPEPTNSHRVSDGIVHFYMEPVFISGTNAFGVPVFDRASNISFSGDELPVFVDLEIGVLEPGTLKQFQSLTNNVTAAQNFLRANSGRIHFFRERVPVRNFVNPYRANEVP